MTTRESQRSDTATGEVANTQANLERLFGASGRSAAFRVGIGLSLTVAVGLLVWRLADWSQMLEALRVLLARPELLGALVASYTGAFVLRAFAWRHLMAGGGGVFDLFTYLQAALLANHLLPFKLGEAVRRRKCIAACYTTGGRTVEVADRALPSSAQPAQLGLQFLHLGFRGFGPGGL